jgi:hypothetical protein
MTAQPSDDLARIGASFAAHVRAFHAGLPAEEQVLLEQIFALADAGSRGEDTGGFGAVNALAAYTGGQGPASFVGLLRPIP